MFDFGASATNIGLQAFHDKKARKWQVDQTDKKYQRDIDQRDYANWYNSPANQMKLYEEAGLNPHLIYGKGTHTQSGTPTAQTAPGRFSKREIHMDPFNEIQKYMGIKKMQSDTALVDAQLVNQNMRNNITALTTTAAVDYQIAKAEKAKSEATTAAERAKWSVELTKLYAEKANTEKANARIRTREADDYENTGIRPGDNAILRMATSFINKLFPSLSGILNGKGGDIEIESYFNNDKQ